MYFSKSAAVLVTLAVGQAAAGSLRHAHLHRARHAEPEPINTEENIEERDVDWSTIDWSKVSYTWSQNQQWTSAPAAAASSVVASVAAAAAPTTTLVTSAAPATSAAASTTVAASSSQTSSSASASSTSGGVIGSIVSSLLDTDSSRLKSMSFAAMGINSKTSGSSIWIGSDGSYTNTFTNKANEDIILVCWGPDGSWVNVKQPLITLSLPQGASTTLSFANGVSGSCAGIYENTQMVNGQISDTWMEFTMSPQGVVDVSREVNMDGHSIEVVGPHCTTNMNKCVFVCSGGATSCMTGYQLLNCDAGSQAGAQSGSDPALGGAASGGCGWLGQDNAKLQTSFT